MRNDDGSPLLCLAALSSPPSLALRSNPNEHGTVWVTHCSTVEIVDIPGNHFTLLNQVGDAIREAPCSGYGLGPWTLPRFYSCLNRVQLGSRRTRRTWR